MKTDKYMPKSLKPVMPRYVLCTITTKDVHFANKAHEVRQLGFAWEDVLKYGVDYITKNQISPLEAKSSSESEAVVK